MGSAVHLRAPFRQSSGELATGKFNGRFAELHHMLPPTAWGRNPLTAVPHKLHCLGCIGQVNPLDKLIHWASIHWTSWSSVKLHKQQPKYRVRL